MSTTDDPYFTPIENEHNQAQANESIKNKSSNKSYFTPIDDLKPLEVPESIQSTDTINKPTKFLFVKTDYPNTNTLKRLMISSLIFFSVLTGWQTYNTFIAMFNRNNFLGISFAILVATFVFFIIKSIYQFKQGQKQVAKIESLREQAHSLLSERSHGKSAEFIKQLDTLYKGRPQHYYLTHIYNQLPDYLNDSEIIERLATDFFAQLDDEAKQIVTQHSITTGTLVAVSQVAVIDSLIVIWRTIHMVNQINSIYGLSLTRFGLCQCFIHIIKAALFSAGTQIGITALVHKFAPGVSGSLLGTVAQGVGMATYVAKIGIETMKQARPIAFTNETLPDINLIRDNVSNTLFTMAEPKPDH